MIERRVIEQARDAFVLPPLVDAATVEKLTGGTVLAEDPATDGLIAAASAVVRSYAQWHIAPVLEETLRIELPYGGVRLDVLLPTGHLVDVLEVRVDGRVVSQPAWVSDGHVWAGYLSAGPHVLEADVQHGYALTEVPDLAGIVAQILAVSVATPGGVVREQTGAVSLSYGTHDGSVAGGTAAVGRDYPVLEAYRIGSEP